MKKIKLDECKVGDILYFKLKKSIDNDHDRYMISFLGKLKKSSKKEYDFKMSYIGLSSHEKFVSGDEKRNGDMNISKAVENNFDIFKLRKDEYHKIAITIKLGSKLKNEH